MQLIKTMLEEIQGPSVLDLNLMLKLTQRPSKVLFTTETNLMYFSKN